MKEPEKSSRIFWQLGFQHLFTVKICMNTADFTVNL